MNNRNEISFIKNRIRKKVKLTILTFLILIVLITVAIIFDLMILGIVGTSICVIAILTLLILILLNSMKIEKEKHYLFIKECINEYSSSGNERLALIYSLYLNDLGGRLEDKGIKSYVYLDTNEELLEIDIIKGNNTLRLVFNAEQVTHTKINFNKKKSKIEDSLTKNIKFNSEEEILNYIEEQYKVMSK